MTVPIDPSHPAEARLFGDTLTCELAVAAAFAVKPLPAGAAQAAAAMLRAVATVEDTGAPAPDERHESTPGLQRVEAKIDLMLGLLGRLAERDGSALPVRPVRWSYKGMRLDLETAPDLADDTPGVLALHPAPWLAAGIELPARVLATADAGDRHCLWLAFEPMPEALTDAMERHLFRLHRRQIAAQRGTAS